MSTQIVDGSSHNLGASAKEPPTARGSNLAAVPGSAKAMNRPVCALGNPVTPLWSCRKIAASCVAHDQVSVVVAQRFSCACSQVLQPAAAKADIWRLAVILRYGGIYVDSDVKALRPFRERVWANASVVSGIGGQRDLHQWCVLPAVPSVQRYDFPGSSKC